MEERKLTAKDLFKEVDKLRTVESDFDRRMVVVPYDLLCNVIYGLQDEIEELKSPKFANWKIKFFKAQEEIERLTEELEVKKKECREIADDYQEMGTFYYNETIKTAELQKQVDELTEKLGKVLLGVKADEVLIAKGVEQAVKDTAKEIYDWFKDNLSVTSSSFEALVKFREFFKSYGVEV